MDTADSVEKALERLMPRGMSEAGFKGLESMIDELAADAPARKPDWLRIGVWTTGGMAAALALGFGLMAGAPVAPSAQPLVVNPPVVELLSQVEGVVRVHPVVDLVTESDGSLHRSWRMEVVNEELFHDAETGQQVRVVRPRDEIVTMPVTSF